jgi:hypothetical protein
MWKAARLPSLSGRKPFRYTPLRWVQLVTVVLQGYGFTVDKGILNLYYNPLFLNMLY